MAELIMRKRAAQAGEIGLFPAAEAFEDIFRTVKMDVDVDVKATTAKLAKYNSLSWHMANLLLAASDQFEYSDEARDWLLVEAKHSRKVYDKLRGKAELKAKGTRHLDGTAWLELIPRLVHVLVTRCGIPEGEIFTHGKDEFFRRDEPPPITEIPEGPGHNSGPAGVSGDLPDRPAAATSEISRPEATPKPAEPEPNVEPPQAVQRGPRPETPTSGRHYDTYARWHIDGAPTHEAAMGWLWTPEQAALRDKLLVPIGQRKTLERYCAEKFGRA
jgi:hypothetical protein